MKRVRILGIAATGVFVAALTAAAVSPAAVGDGFLGGPTLPDAANSVCSDEAFAGGISGTEGTIAANPFVKSVRVECLGGASPVGTVGNGATNPRESLCQPGDVAIGITGREGDFIDSIAVRCRDDSLTGPVDDRSGWGGAGGAEDGPYDCPEGEALVGLAGSVTEDMSTASNVLIMCAPRAATTTTVGVKTPGKKIKVNGTVKPDQVGEKVTVTLSRKKGAKYTKVEQKKPTLGAGSIYDTSFESPDATDCKVKVKWPGDVDSEPSSASEKFNC